MKHETFEKAKELYFQTNMNKKEIAEKVGVNRKTILFWSRQNNWDKVRQSSRNMPSLIAEKCYYVIDQYLNNLLADGGPSSLNNVHLKDAQTVHLFATTLKKLKNRSTINESMEMFNFFMDGLNRRDPAVAEAVKPHIEEYINIRANNDTRDFLMEEFSNNATLPYSDQEIQENHADNEQLRQMADDYADFLNSRNEPGQSTPPGNPGPEPDPQPVLTRAA